MTSDSRNLTRMGTVIQALPRSCTSVFVNGGNYSDCGGVFYKVAFQGNYLIYVDA
jgi:hypothetical protein